MTAHFGGGGGGGRGFHTPFALSVIGLRINIKIMEIKKNSRIIYSRRDFNKFRYLSFNCPAVLFLKIAENSFPFLICAHSFP
jgi:hypothetical protein